MNRVKGSRIIITARSYLGQELGSSSRWALRCQLKTFLYAVGRRVHIPILVQSPTKAKTKIKTTTEKLCIYSHDTESSPPTAGSAITAPPTNQCSSMWFLSITIVIAESTQVFSPPQISIHRKQSRARHYALCGHSFFYYFPNIISVAAQLYSSFSLRWS